MLQLDGRAIGDSTAVIAAIEERYPEPPLYPADPEQRRRALELEDFFDEELGPHMRLLAFYELINEPQMFAEIASASVPGPLGKAKGFVGAYARTYASLRFGPPRRSGGAARPRSSPRWTASRRAGRNRGEYLVGDFSVADLTAASLFYPWSPGRGTGLPGRADPPRHRALPRRPPRPPRLPLGRRDVPPPPPAGSDRRGGAAEPQPPIGARGFAPQKTTVPSMPMMWTRMMLTTIDWAVAVPTPTGPPEAV